MNPVLVKVVIETLELVQEGYLEICVLVIYSVYFTISSILSSSPLERHSRLTNIQHGQNEALNSQV
jgi:hypothetical protein